MAKEELPIAKPKPEEEITFPQEFALIIEEVLRKYGLFKPQEERVKEMLLSTNVAEKKRILESLPGYQISKFVREFAEGKKTLAEFPLALKEKLDLHDSIIKKIVHDINQNILSFIKPRETKIMPPTKDSIGSNPEEPLPSVPPKKSASPKEPDVYREPIN